MQLLFRCPQTGRQFLTEHWRVKGTMDTVVLDGRKTLDGSVHADCPYCGSVHSYEPDQLSCPLSCGHDPRA
jgi:hypothetical protein